MGVAKFDWKEIPLSKNIDTTNLYFNHDYLKKGFALNIGNPHLIFFADTLDFKMLKKDSEKIIKSKLFSEGVNISVVKVNSRNTISVITYEERCRYYSGLWNWCLCKCSGIKQIKFG